MKTYHFLFLQLFFITPAFLSAQSMIGDWVYTGSGPDGAEVTNIMSMKEDGTLSVDFGSDGQVEVVASYVIDGDKITINDMAEQSPCYGKAGVYNFKVEGDTITITLVEDACEVRRRDRPWTLKRK